MNKHSLKNKGFTLVELIVVLVILAILAAILVPALLGFIDRAREKQDVLAARNCMMAAQAELVEIYGKTQGVVTGDTVIPGVSSVKNNNRDVELSGTTFRSDVLATADDDPYCFFFATGSTKTGGDETVHDMYTVYYAFYMADEDSEPLHYYNGTWTRTSPHSSGDISSSNEITVNGRKFPLQYYVVNNAGGKKLNVGYGNNSNLWWWLLYTLKNDE